MKKILAFLALSLLIVSTAYADLVTVGINNNLGKNDKPTVVLNTVIVPLNKDAIESGLDAEQIKLDMDASLKTKSFQLSDNADAVLTIKLTSIKNKSDFSAQANLELSGKEKVTSSGVKYHQEIWSGQFLFSYDTASGALNELRNIVDIFSKSYLISDKEYKVGEVINMGGKNYRVVPFEPNDPEYNPKDPLGIR